jgi:hypothetical protein
MVSLDGNYQPRIPSQCLTHATMKNTNPSAKMRWARRERPPEGLYSLYAVRQRTIKSKHMEYMNVAERMVLLVEVMIHPTPGFHSALRRIPAVIFIWQISYRQEFGTVKNERPVTHNDEGYGEYDEPFP